MKPKRSVAFKSLQGIVLVIIISTAAYLLSNDNSEGLANAKPQRSLYATNTTRLSIVSTYCTSSSISISQSDRSTNNGYQSALSSYMKANATRLVVDLVNGNFGDLMTEIQINGAGTIFFISPFFIGLALLILAFPCLLCCCTCQQSCPPKCCRGKNPNYSHSQLTMPTVILILLCILITATAVSSMTNSKPFFSDFSCSISKFLDDFYHGNQTQSQQYFFSGITQIRYQLYSVLSSSLSAVNTQITRLKPTAGTVMNTLLADINTVLSNLQLIPRGSDSLQFTQTYNEPLDSSTTPATFNTVLGPKIGTYGNSSTLLGALYSYFSSMYASMNAIANAASNVQPHLTSGDMGNQITITDGILAGIQGNLDSLTSQIQSVLTLLSAIDSMNTSYSIPFYGIILGQALLILLGMIFMKCLNMLACRYFIYFICLIMFFFCLLLFIYAIILAILMPSLFYTCSYFQNTFTTPTGFTNMILTLQGNSYSDLANQFSQCFGGTSNFMQTLNPTLNNYINYLQTSIFNSYQYDFAAMTSSINSQVTTMKDAIDNIGLGHLPDFDTTTTDGQAQIIAFNNIADKSIYNSACPQASFNIFYQDVWVPGLSTTYQSSVGCRDKVGIDNATCGSNIGNTATCSNSRCFDTFSIISSYYRGGTIANLATHANTRYGTCAPFDSYLTNFYTNYVKVVVDNIGNSVDDAADTTKLAGRFVTNAQTPVNNLKDEMNGAVKTLFTQVYNHLTQTDNLQSIFDPSLGVFTGLDCRLLGEDGLNAKESLCITSFNRIYFTLVTVGILAFALFFTLCCVVCFNVRHYQKSIQGKEFPGRIFPLDETSSEIQMK